MTHVEASWLAEMATEISALRPLFVGTTCTRTAWMQLSENSYLARESLGNVRTPSLWQWWDIECVLHVFFAWWYNPLTVSSDLQIKCEVHLVCQWSLPKWVWWLQFKFICGLNVHCPKQFLKNHENYAPWKFGTIQYPNQCQYQCSSIIGLNLQM